MTKANTASGANGVSGVLVRHFFRRFFDSDTVSAEGDTVTTVVRAVSIAAAPGLIVAFFLQNQYPRRSMWGSIEDHYFFVLLTFVVLGAVAVFEWEMLFPDRLDFLILSPLSIRPLTMLGAKLAALAGFLGLFLFASSVFGAIVLPAVSKGDFPRQMMAHAAAVLMAGVFASLLFLAVGGGLICVLSASWFKVALPVVQTFSITALLLAMMHYFKCGDAMQAMLGHEPGMLRWMPPMWFLGVYEQVLRGDGAPAFAAEMTKYAVRGTLVAGVAVAVTYPLAWVRMQRMAMEGSGGRYGEPSRWLTRVQHWAVRRAETRGVFHFIGQTMRRSSRYQVYLAMYCGTGFALAVACAVTYRLDGAGVPRAGLASDGLRALTPLLLFWMVAGLRGAFAIPINLLARWVFRMAGVTMQVCAGAGRQWALVCSVGVLGWCWRCCLRRGGMRGNWRCRGCWEGVCACC